MLGRLLCQPALLLEGKYKWFGSVLLYGLLYVSVMRYISYEWASGVRKQLRNLAGSCLDCFCLFVCFLCPNSLSLEQRKYLISGSFVLMFVAFWICRSVSLSWNGGDRRFIQGPADPWHKTGSPVQCWDQHSGAGPESQWQHGQQENKPRQRNTDPCAGAGRLSGVLWYRSRFYCVWFVHPRLFT